MESVQERLPGPYYMADRLIIPYMQE
jgi:hypothetical protein